MPSYLSPGVYVEEVASGSRPIEGVGTSVAAFVGLAPSGPLNEPTLVTNWTQYVAAFGDFTEGYFLAHSVYGFFNNGGSAAYVVRVGGSAEGTAGEAGPAAVTGTTAPAALPAAEPAQLGTFAVTALAPGTKGPLTVEVADPEGEGAAERFKLVVKDGGKAVETFDVSAKKGTRSYVVTQVKEQSKLISVTEAAPTGQLARPENQTVTPAAPP
ncbi:phage tail sheath family protein, partial [Streptomyces sp. McG2]|nr:phage tail sheath family protein [Streptomyces sp. McG2]